MCELFQFEGADLHFGVYRIMNHKRDVVERFISQRSAHRDCWLLLDHYFNRRAELLRSLNAFVAAHNAQRLAGEPLDAAFLPEDLKKLAFWMAAFPGV